MTASVRSIAVDRFLLDINPDGIEGLVDICAIVPPENPCRD